MAWQEFAPTSYNTDPLGAVGSYATLVGADPLATSDGDSSYVETYLESGDTSATKSGTFRLSPAPGGGFTRVKVAAVARGVDGPSDVVLGVKVAGRADGVALVTNQMGLSDSYEFREYEINFAALPGSLSWLTPDLVMAPTSYFTLDNTAGIGEARFMRATWLRVYAFGGARPLRWRQRNDGLGGGAPRAARGVTSQQGSNRHRGYL